MKQPMLRFKADDGSDFPDWESKSFSDVFTGLSNNTLSRDCLNSERGQAKNIHYGDVLIKYGSVVDIQTDGVPFVNSDIDCKRWDCLKDGDIVIADTAEDDTVGKAVEIINVGSDTLFSGLHTIACRPKVTFASKYLAYYMNSKAYHNQLRPYMQGIKVTSVSKSNISLTHIEIPSLPEQRKIADLLSTVDSVIAAQQAEVDAWEQRKKGAMQKLFSQEVRFKADDGGDFPDWEKKTLGNEGRFYGGLTGKTKKDFETGNACFVTYMNVYKNTFARQDMMGCVSVGAGEKQNKVLCGDLLFTQSSETVEEVGLASVYLHDDEPYLNSFCMGYRFNNPRKVYPEFIGYCLRSDGVRKSIMPMGQGISRINLSAKRLGTVSFRIPSLPEQRKIADCLSSIDNVIVKLKAELMKWQELKKGLLQQMFV